MEDFVVSDLAKSAYIVNAAILDDNGFIVAAQPDNDKSKEMLAKLTEIHYITDQSQQTSIITEKLILIISRLACDYTLIVGCDSKSNLGHVRQTIASAAARLDSFLQSRQA